MLVKLKEMGSVLHMSLFLLLGGFLTGGANGADRVELNGLQNQFTPTVSDKPPDELGKTIGFAAGLEDGSELSFQQKTSASNIDHLH
jgi:hypothetical protein